MESSVRGAVSPSMQTMSIGLARRCWDGSDAAEAGKGSFRSQSIRIIADGNK
jgi:hypothetical protein